MNIEFQKESRLRGIAVSPGVVCARIYVKKMMEIGIEMVSVSAKLIPGVRKAALAQIAQVNST